MQDNFKNIILSTYATFNKDYLIKIAKIGNKEFYQANYSGNCKNVNNYFWLEEDVKVKYGGYLDYMLLNETPNTYTVHSENTPLKQVDLSVHDISDGKLWTNNDINIGSTRAIFEIKFAPFKDPNCVCTSTSSILTDIEKLKLIEQEICKKELLKFMVIIDEGNNIMEKWIRTIAQKAKENNIIILSNNPCFID
jgi:hypothetical protein